MDLLDPGERPTVAAAIGNALTAAAWTRLDELARASDGSTHAGT